MLLLNKLVYPRFYQSLLISSRRFSKLCDTGEDEDRIKCTLIPGDGVGPDLVKSVRQVFEAANIPVDFETFHLSEVDTMGSATLDEVTRSIRKNRIALKGILAYPDKSQTTEVETMNMKLRKRLDLFANVVHIQSLAGIHSRHRNINIDTIIIREQTEGEYSALEHESVKGVVECLKIITAVKSRKIAKFAFDYATYLNRKKVTAVHKANIMKLGDGLFLKSCDEMARLYPKLKYEKMIVDNCTMQLVVKPQQFDVLLTPNLYGNIIDNLAAGLVGGAGMVAGSSYSQDCVVFEPGARHTFQVAVGKQIANPTAMLLASAKLLAHCNLHAYSCMIRNAINKVLKKGEVLTQDIGGCATTDEYTEEIINNLEVPKYP